MTALTRSQPRLKMILGWLEELALYCIDERDIIQVIVANKIDLETKRQVSTMCGQALADKFKLDYIETSAKNGANVELIFNLLAESLDLAHKTNEKTAAQKAQIEVVTELEDSRSRRRSHRSQRSSSIRLSRNEPHPDQISTDQNPSRPVSKRWQCCTF